MHRETYRRYRLTACVCGVCRLNWKPCRFGFNIRSAELAVVAVEILTDPASTPRAWRVNNAVGKRGANVVGVMPADYLGGLPVRQSDW